jgi:hypothetical protein
VTWAGRPDTISIGSSEEFAPELIDSIRNEARNRSLPSTIAHQGTVELIDASLPTTFAYPIWTVAFEPEAAGQLYGPQVQGALAAGKAVLSDTSASLRKLGIGAKLQLASWVTADKVLAIEVGEIVTSERAATGELLLPLSVARDLGLQRPWRVFTWGDRARIEEVGQAAAERVGSRHVHRSWNAPSVDDTLSTVALKQLLGEFSVFRRQGQAAQSGGESVEIDPEWVRTNMVTTDVPIIGRITCHRTLIQPIISALTELELAGLAPLINVADTRRAGGCWNTRLIRSNTGTAARNLSRHSWGAALDINPSTNAYGATPQMDERIVDVFRRNGFAWGGTWAFPDGMHFEFIGAPRISGARLPIATTTTSTTTTTTTTTSTSTTTTPPTTSTTIATTTSTTIATTLTTSIAPVTTRLVTTSSVPSTTPATSTSTTPVSTTPTASSPSTTSTTSTPPAAPSTVTSVAPPTTSGQTTTTIGVLG